MTAPDVSLDEKVRFLSSADTFGDGTKRVEVVETHMAFVFLTERYAWKMKKPVKHPFLDFTTLEARHRDCREEVRLNRRLAPQVYLGVVPLTRADGDGLALAGQGEPVEWLVRMIRLSEHRMLDRVIARGEAGREEVKPAAQLLGAFYRDAPAAAPAPISPRERFHREAKELRNELSRPAFGLPGSRVQELALLFEDFLHRHEGLLDERTRRVEGHGDLRPEHVHLGPPPAVIDCLEFDEGLRTLDPAEDLAFLWMECERLGAAEVGEHVLEVYRRFTGDRPDPELLRFYRGYRAFLRAKLAIWHLRDGVPEQDERWRRVAREYIDLARGHLEP